ncbi:MAG: DUF1836 domain-containing protein [Clostridia bacterium]|nr:DUF1836 domain-containing protein [Clostridia bacterium]
MATTLPGTNIEVSTLKAGTSRTLFDGLFAAGGISLSQVAVMTGLEPHVIQNWVKRGFVSSPVRRQYSKNQFSRIVIINMLRESLQLEHICETLAYINGDLTDELDDIISDSELYHTYTDMIADSDGPTLNRKIAQQLAERTAAAYPEPFPGAGKRLAKTLQVMAYAHGAALARQAAEEILAQLR